MSQSQTPGTTSTDVQLTSPNQYQFSGHGIHVSYLPSGAGGVSHLTYQDTHRTVSFSGDQDIRKVETPDLGTLVSVTLSILPDVGSTTFSLVVPLVNLVNQRGSSAAVHTFGVTTMHSMPFAGPSHQLGQRESYTVTLLSGTASLGIIPL